MARLLLFFMRMRTATPLVRLTRVASTLMAVAVAAACGASRERVADDGAAGESSSRSGSGGGAAGAAANAGGGSRAGAGAGAGGAAGAVGVGMAGRDDTMSNPDPPGDAAVPVDAEIDAATESPSGAECVVARRLTTCCPEYVPVTRAQLEADECLVELPVGPIFGTDLTRPCQTISCVGVQCPQDDPPLSRIAVSDGEGGCRYGDECLSDEDCALGNATSGCCDCPRSMPVALFALNPCAQLQGEPYPTSDQCLGCTAPVLCGACAPSPEPRCSIRDTFSLCE